MANHGIVRLDKLQAIYGGNIESVQASVDLDNGSVVVIGGLVAGKGGEVVSANAIVTAGLPTDEVLLVASPELVYDEKREGLVDFYNAKNKPARAYHFTVGDIVTVTDDMIDGTSVKDKYLIPANGKTKLVPATDLSGGTRFAAQVIEKGKTYGVASTTYRVVKC